MDICKINIQNIQNSYKNDKHKSKSNPIKKQYCKQFSTKRILNICSIGDDNYKKSTIIELANVLNDEVEDSSNEQMLYRFFRDIYFNYE
jgi:hypothetical protein